MHPLYSVSRKLKHLQNIAVTAGVAAITAVISFITATATVTIAAAVLTARATTTMTTMTLDSDGVYVE